MAFVNEKPEGNSDAWRTVDYERGVVLRRTGGIPYDEGDRFELTWKEQKVNFIASEKNQYDEQGNTLTKDWFLSWIDIPDSLKDERAEIKELIAAALNVYGFLYKRGAIKTVNVSFNNFL